jgi:Rrf2 family nitric oxide-sensitive transcriptional repressor
MRLNAQTDFSLRIMMYLAAKSGQPATVQEVATKLKLSQAHTMRIVAKLASCGLIASTRGRSGGVHLGRGAGLITVEQVVKAIEPDFKLVHCFEEENGCSVEPACVLKNVLSSALEAFFADLRAVTLADLTEPNRSSLAEIFHLEDLLQKNTKDKKRARIGGVR